MFVTIPFQNGDKQYFLSIPVNNELTYVSNFIFLCFFFCSICFVFLLFCFCFFGKKIDLAFNNYTFFQKDFVSHYHNRKIFSAYDSTPTWIWNELQLQTLYYTQDIIIWRSSIDLRINLLFLFQNSIYMTVSLLVCRL